MRSLECFEQAAAFASFSKAAEAIGMTHGAISHQVRGLEEWLGVPLFERHASGVRLTDEGDSLCRACSVAFSLLEEECAKLRQRAQLRTIKIGCSSTFLAHWLLPRLESFSTVKENPDLSFHTRADLSALATGQIDALIDSAADVPNEAIGGIRLVGDRIGPICGTTWKPLPASPMEVSRMPLLHAASRPTAWQEWAAAVGIKLSYDRGSQFDSLALTIEAARVGLGLAMAPEHLIQADVREGRLLAPLGFAEVGRSTWIFYRKEIGSDRILKRFLDWICEHPFPQN